MGPLGRVTCTHLLGHQPHPGLMGVNRSSNTLHGSYCCQNALSIIMDQERGVKGTILA